DMIIYGDLQTIKGEDGTPQERRTLRFRSDGNILCGTRFRNFPKEIDNDVTTFIKTFKDAVLGLYGGNEKAVEEAKAEQEAKAEKQAENLVVQEANTPEAIKDKITLVIETMEKEDKIKCAKFFKETLGNADYKKSDDVEGLTKALEFVKSV